MQFVPKFKKGDVLINLDGVGAFTAGEEYIAQGDSYRNDVGEEFVRVRGNHGYVVSRFVHRFKLKEEKPVEKKIEVGSIVFAVQAFSLLAHGIPYQIEKLYPDGTAKVKGISIRYSLSRFILGGNEAIMPPPMVKKSTLLDELDKKADGRPGTATYAVRTENGKTNFHVRDACHARLNTRSAYGGEILRNDVVSEVAFYLKGHVEGKLLPDYTKFVDYVINRSPVSKCFIPVSGEEAVKLGVMGNVNVTNNELVTAAVFLRTGSEYQARLSMFTKLVDMGFPENTAYVASQYINRTDKLGYYYGQNGGGHHFFADPCDVKEFAEFFRKGFNRKVGEPYSKSHSTRYEIINRVAKTVNNDENIWSFLKRNTGACVKKGDWGSEHLTFSNDDKGLMKAALGIHALMSQ